MTLKELKSIASEFSIDVPENAESVIVEKIIDKALSSVGADVASIENGSITKTEIKKRLDEFRNVKPAEKVTTAIDKPDPEEVERLRNLTFAKAAGQHEEVDKHTVLKDATKLVRCQISCNNKNKSEYRGEIFSVRNALIPEQKKFVPFNVPTHVPTIILNMIKEKRYQLFKDEKASNGRTVKRSYTVPEYNISILPPLTTEEFNAIKQKQLAEGQGN